MMRLTIHRGAREIGGNCIEIQSGKTRLVLDVGMPLFGADRKPFDDTALRGKTVDELLEARVLPGVPGLFAEGPAPDAILLSHAHMDHTGFLSYTRAEIPVHATTGTSKMMKAGALFARQQELPRERFQKLIAGTSQEIGSLRVTTFAVDHSVFGSSAFLIEGDGKAILYSGDLRLHGRKTGMAKTMLAALADKNIDVLLMEGTHVAAEEAKNINEYDLGEEIAQHVASAPGLVLASFSPQHVDRLVGFIKAAQRTHRVFVADVYTAYLLYSIAPDVKVPPPTVDQGIRAYYPEYFRASYKRKRLDKIHDRFPNARITLDEIRAEPEKYVMVFRPSMLDSDFAGTLPEKTLCLYSRWEGYLQQPEWQTTKQKIEAGGGELRTVHTSGHITPGDLVKFVANVGPKTVVPIHTFDPDGFGRHFQNVRVLKDGECLEI